jgi:predicted N-formylglutamate amidohydrolase
MSEQAFNVYNSGGSHPVVLVCEHASARIPAVYRQLGLAGDLATSHIAWDPGALETARYLADALDAVLVEGTVSRLIYDLNRPPESPGAMATVSERHEVPGNRALQASERKRRVDLYYQPFVSEVSRVLQAHHCTPVLVTIHTFTPVYHGRTREVEIGVLHDADSRLADAMLDGASTFNVQRNQPYGPDDGVTHTLQLHGLPGGLLNVMIEIRNDLVGNSAACQSMATHLGHWLTDSLQQLIPAPATGLQS